MNTLEDFLKTGCISEIHLGGTVESIILLIGETDEKAKVNREVSIWKYQDLQITFQRSCVEKITISTNEELVKLPDSICKEHWPISESTKIEEMLDIIDSANVMWRVDEKWSFDRQLCIRTEGEVQIMFDLDFRKMSDLYCCRYNVTD